MVASIESFGHVKSTPGETAMVRLANPGIKSALAVVCGYMISAATPPPPPGTFAEPSFWGRLFVVRANAAVREYPIVTNVEHDLGMPVFDIPFHSVGPHIFLFPIAELQGTATGGADSPISIILCPAQTLVGGELFRGFLNVSGQVSAPYI